MLRRTTRSLIVLLALSSILAPPLRAGQGHTRRIEISDGQLLFEFVGQVTNPTGTTSHQYGYFTFVSGLDDLFSGSPADEGTARLTFFREGTNVRVSSNGPLRVIMREGTTTVYANMSAASFADPDSFKAGIPVLTSTFKQQVVVDTTSGVFTVVNEETITHTGSFSVNGQSYVIGEKGDVYRTRKQGRNNATSPPDGHFAGFSVGAGH
jgi:hypothetical protein